MRAVLQKVKRARVSVAGKVTGAIETGWVIFLGIGKGDDPSEVDWLIGRLLGLKLFGPEEDPKNLTEVDGGILVISQFTLFANCRKGSKPSWHRAADPAEGHRLYNHFLTRLRESTAQPVAEGIFGAMMEVELSNDGPVTLVLDTQNKDG